MEKEAAKEEDGLLGDLGLKSFSIPYPPQSKERHINLFILLVNDSDSKNNA